MEKSTIIGGLVISTIAGLGYGIMKGIDSYSAKKRSAHLCKLDEAHKTIKVSLDCQTTLEDEVWIDLMNETIKKANKDFGKDIVAEIMLLKGFLQQCGKYRKTVGDIELELSVA